jgi:quinol monooxygenase YgiN
MRASPGRGSELEIALTDLAARIRECAGCEQVEIFADLGDSDRYVFIEHWRSPADRDAAGAALGKQTFACVAATLAEPPATCDLRAANSQACPPPASSY